MSTTSAICGIELQGSLRDAGSFGVVPGAEALVITHIFLPVIAVPLLDARQNSPRGGNRDALRACFRRQGRHSYQPRATPWVYRPKSILSAESAIHCPEGLRPGPHAASEGALIGPKETMSQADGLQKNEPARKPRALPWAGMNQAFGLRATDTVGSPQRVGLAMWVKTSAEAPGYSRDVPPGQGLGSTPGEHSRQTWPGS